MKNLFWKSAALIVLLASPVMAADLAVRTPAPAPLPPRQDWSGIYVGLEGGYGWGKQSTDAISPGDEFAPVVIDNVASEVFQLTPPLFFPDLAVPSIKQNGWLFGGFFGAQKQWGNWIFGIEGDIDGANIKGSGTTASSTSSNVANFSNASGSAGVGTSCVASPCFTLNHNVSLDSKIDALASLSGKVGWSFAPDWLIYGTGGAAFAHVANTFISTESAVIAPQFTAFCLSFTCIFPNNSSLNTRPWCSASNISTMDFQIRRSHSATTPEESSPSELKRT